MHDGGVRLLLTRVRDNETEEKGLKGCCGVADFWIDQYIAFKVKTTNPKKYCVRPNTGIVQPSSVCNVTEAPPDVQCKDKFVLQAEIAPNWATNKDITANMFNKEENKVVEEFKLRVVYIPANPPSPVPEESEEASSPRGEDGNLNSSWADVERRSVEPKE